MTGTAAFNADLRAFAEKIDVNLQTVLKRVTFDLWNRITLKTPVDTGRARAGWGVSIGDPQVVTPEPGPHGAPTPPDLSAIDGTQLIYVLNNVEYVQYLEEGTSKQAPAGMVRISLAEVELEIEAMLLAMQ